MSNPDDIGSVDDLMTWETNDVIFTRKFSWWKPPLDELDNVDRVL